jgi:hypothetical protein
MNPGKSTKQPTLRDVVMQQFRINNDINVKLAVNDKILEDINVKMNNFSSAINVQLAYNKKIESKLAQLAAALPVATNPEQVQAITIRGGRTTRDPPYPKGARRAPTVSPMVEGENNYEVDQGVLPQEP